MITKQTSNDGKTYREPRRFYLVLEQFPVCNQQSIIVDALFGTGLNRDAEGLSASLIKHLNKQAARRVSIDVPSGLFIDKATTDLSNVIHASATSFSIV